MTSVSENTKYSDAVLIGRYDKRGKCCGQLVIALGFAVLFGWVTGIVALTNIFPGWVAMQPNTALCLILAGTSLLGARIARLSHKGRSVQLASATILAVVALATLAEYALGLRFGIDQFFHAGSSDGMRLHYPGRMAVATAASFFFVGTALILLDTKAAIVSQLLALLAVLVAMLVIFGYAYGVTSLYAIGFFSTVALHTAIGIWVVSVGILFVRPAHGVVTVLVSSTVGGVLARRLLPLAVGVPFVLGWLCIQGEQMHLYDSRFAVVMTSLTYVILLGFLTWHISTALRRSDHSRLDAERIKQLQQAQMSGLIESAMDAIVMLDEAQCIIVFNPAAEKMFGYAHAEIIGSGLSKLLPQRFRTQHDKHLHAFGESGSASRRMGSLGKIAALRSDGTEFPAEASISQFNMGQGICYTAIVRDTTERTHIEAALHASERRERERSQELSDLLFAVPAAVCFARDPLVAELTGNELFHRWFRESGTDELSQAGANGAANTPFALHKDRVGIHSLQAALKDAAAGIEIRDYEFQHTYPDGSIRYLFGNAMPLRDELGGACGSISAFVDVTELKLSELAMLSVTAGSVAKSDYITHMTHELRTPLGTLLGFAQILEIGVPPPSQAQFASIRQILKAGWYLRDLITEVQDLATIEADAAHMSCERVEIDVLLQDLHAMIQPLVFKAGLYVTLPATGNGLGIRGNPVRIKQVMLNLLSNAIKYNRIGGSIDVSCFIDGSAQVRIEVRDTGHGLSPKEVASLFQPFNRLGQERGKEVGTGVGLVVTKKLVESMGGTIGAESEVGRGTLFWFSMPAANDLSVLEKS